MDFGICDGGGGILKPILLDTEGRLYQIIWIFSVYLEILIRFREEFSSHTVMTGLH